jgi:hypothetical protein
MLCFVEIAFGGRRHHLKPGAIIGRCATADLLVPHPTVSEAHALVSHRGRSLKLLALRRWFHVDGKKRSEVSLAQGQVIELSPYAQLEVGAVQLPPSVLALEGLGAAPVELRSPVYSVALAGRRLALHDGYRVDALAVIWSATDSWWIQVENGTPEEIVVGRSWTVGEGCLGAVGVESSAALSTVGLASMAPVRLVVRHDTVHLHPANNPPAVLSGIPARIVSELAALGAPAPWRVVAGEIWRGSEDDRLLRQNWDRNMRRLRAALRAAGVRPDLVRPDGRGNTELFLLPDDVLVDEQ